MEKNSIDDMEIIVMINFVISGVFIINNDGKNIFVILMDVVLVVKFVFGNCNNYVNG